MKDFITFVLAMVANIYKIQHSWFWEVVAIFSMFILIFVTAMLLRSYKKKRNVQNATGFPKLLHKTVKILLVSLITFFSLGALLHGGLVAYIVSKGGDLNSYAFKTSDMKNTSGNVLIKDEKGATVYTITNNNKNKEYASKEEIPKILKDAVVATEDKTFYNHSGISVKGYLRAIFYKIMKPNAPMNGGSTITQQLVKNINEDMYGRTIVNKYQEALMAVIIESKYTKEEILEMYLNNIFLGTSENGNLYGVATASKYYFDKNVSELKISESAYIAGLAKAPSTYTTDLEQGNNRKDTVLDLMEQYGAITHNQKLKEDEVEIKLIKKSNANNKIYAPYADYVIHEAKEKYGIKKEDIFKNGYDIVTYINKDMQENMYKAMENRYFTDDKGGKDIVQVGMAAIDNTSRKIVGIYGGRNYEYGYQNRSYAKYQPGSILKPFVAYGPALDLGKFNAFSKIKDEETDFGDYKPKNSNNKFAGTVTLEQALIRSLNIPAVKVLKNIGVEYGLNSLTNVGIDIEEEDKGLHVALGGMKKGVTPVQMAQAYSTLPNYGYYEEANAIKTIKTKNGEIIKKEEEIEKQKSDVFQSQTAFNLTEILEKVVTDRNGTGQAAKIGSAVAGKTGTAQEPMTKDGQGNRAAWFVGYTPEFTLSVYTGFDAPSETNTLSFGGGGTPAEIFASVMKKQMKNYVKQDFKQPVNANSLYEIKKLDGVENIEIEYNKKEKRIEMTWDSLDNVSGVTYKIYSANEDGEFKQIGKTSDTKYYDYSLNTKALEYEDLSGGIGGITGAIFENVEKGYKNVIGETKKYYIVSEYNNVQSKKSKVAKKWIAKD